MRTPSGPAPNGASSTQRRHYDLLCGPLVTRGPRPSAQRRRLDPSARLIPTASAQPSGGISAQRQLTNMNSQPHPQSPTAPAQLNGGVTPTPLRPDGEGSTQRRASNNGKSCGAQRQMHRHLRTPTPWRNAQRRSGRTKCGPLVTCGPRHPFGPTAKAQPNGERSVWTTWLNRCAVAVRHAIFRDEVAAVERLRVPPAARGRGSVAATCCVPVCRERRNKERGILRRP